MAKQKISPFQQKPIIWVATGVLIFMVIFVVYYSLTNSKENLNLSLASDNKTILELKNSCQSNNGVFYGGLNLRKYFDEYTRYPGCASYRDGKNKAIGYCCFNNDSIQQNYVNQYNDKKMKYKSCTDSIAATEKSSLRAEKKTNPELKVSCELDKGMYYGGTTLRTYFDDLQKYPTRACTLYKNGADTIGYCCFKDNGQLQTYKDKYNQQYCAEFL